MILKKLFLIFGLFFLFSRQYAMEPAVFLQQVALSCIRENQSLVSVMDFVRQDSSPGVFLDAAMYSPTQLAEYALMQTQKAVHNVGVRPFVASYPDYLHNPFILQAEIRPTVCTDEKVAKITHENSLLQAHVSVGVHQDSRIITPPVARQCELMHELRGAKAYLHLQQQALHNTDYLQGLLSNLKEHQPTSMTTGALKDRIEKIEQQMERTQGVINTTIPEIQRFTNQHDITDAGVAALRHSDTFNIEAVAREHNITNAQAKYLLEKMNTELKAEIALEGLEVQQEYLKGIVARRELQSEISQMSPADYHESLAKCAADIKKISTDLSNARLVLKECETSRNSCKDNITSYNTTLGWLKRGWEKTVGTGLRKEDYERGLGNWEKLINEKTKEIRDNNASLRKTEARQNILQENRSTITEAYRQRCQGEGIETLSRNLHTKQAVIQSEENAHSRPNISDARLNGLREEIGIIQEAIDQKHAQQSQESVTQPVHATEPAGTISTTAPSQQENLSQSADNGILLQSEKKDLWQDAHRPDDLCLNKEIFSEELLGDMSVTPRTSDISKKYNLFNLPTDRQLTSDEKDLLRQQVDLLNKITQLPDSLALNKQLSAGIVSAIEKIHGGIEHVGVSLIKLSQECLWQGNLAKANFLTRLSAEVSEKLALALFKGPLKGTASAGKFLVRAALEPVDSVVKPLGNIADLIGKLEAAADLLETNPKAASEMYDKISKDFDPALDATAQYFKTATWDQILEDGIAVGTEAWLLGKFVSKGAELTGSTLKAVKTLLWGDSTTAGSGLNNITELLERGTKIGDRIETMIDENAKIIFRKDFGANAHPISSHGYHIPVNHYNVEIHTKAPNRRWERELNLHIIVNEAEDVIDFFQT